jgi:hypothetical protein
MAATSCHARTPPSVATIPHTSPRAARSRASRKRDLRGAVIASSLLGVDHALHGIAGTLRACYAPSDRAHRISRPQRTRGLGQADSRVRLQLLRQCQGCPSRDRRRRKHHVATGRRLRRLGGRGCWHDGRDPNAHGKAELEALHDIPLGCRCYARYSVARRAWDFWAWSTPGPLTAPPSWPTSAPYRAKEKRAWTASHTCVHARAAHRIPSRRS